MKQEKGQVDFIQAGSSLKICLVAEGGADIYPRLGPTMEWDTAAGHAVAMFAGAKIFDYKTNEELGYNKPNLLNPWFVVERI
jgi:3'(2'), 5'-bisphosphate nucleotidase